VETFSTFSANNEKKSLSCNRHPREPVTSYERRNAQRASPFDKLKKHKLMKFTSLLIAGTILSGASLVQADEKTFGDGTLPEFLQEYDVNEDGKIDEEERQAFKEARKATRDEHRAKIDTNDDGKISDEERQAARDAVRAAIEAKRAEKFAKIAGDDGLLSLEELSAVPHLKKLSAERIASIFARLDADENGGISLEEFNARLRHHRPENLHGRPENPGDKGKDDDADDDADDDDDDDDAL